jgi:hypothetical protein
MKSLARTANIARNLHVEHQKGVTLGPREDRLLSAPEARIGEAALGCSIGSTGS